MPFSPPSHGSSGAPAGPQRVLITVTGPDRPGITAALTQIIADGAVEIADMEQVVIQGLLSLSIVLDFRDAERGGEPVLKELLFAAKAMGMELDFRVLAAHEAQPRRLHRSVLTLLGQGQLSARGIARVAQVLAQEGFNIESIQRLDEGRIGSLELIVSSDDPGGARTLKSALLPVSRDCALDIALQPDNLFRRIKRLVVFDLDSTLIQVEIIDELAKAWGVAEQVQAITARAMDGGMDFPESLRRRVALLRGLEESALARLYEQLPLTPGAEQLIRTLQRLGYRTAIISGGFTFFSERLKARLGLDYAFANRLELAGGRLTGRVIEPVIDGEGKARLLEEIARQENLRLDQVIAIGDGANDLPMLRKAGLGIAFNARPMVREAADHSLNQRNLDSILFLLGISQSDLAELAREG
ncbi:MAG: phosphoserine phosphatase SerB [Candidatus Lambdaproteobacteria bacterium]|nr:phosphoserine phosphatase SerB [Candidatus Lambdaproteobacteria bacterium]